MAHDALLGYSAALQAQRDAQKEEEEEDAEVAGLKKVNASDLHGSCPGDPTGKTCLSGSDGVDGVHEWSAFSHGKSWNTRWLEKKGVNVGEWGIPKFRIHHWNRKPVDKPGKEAKEPDWAKMKTPQWAWENNAMRSQGWDPEGVKNRQLILGAGYGENVTQSDVMDDAYVNRSGYTSQFSVQQKYHPHDDHFADWKPNSTENVRLLYGDSAFTNDLRWSIRLRKWVKEKWSWGDDHMKQSDFARQLQQRGPRSGEPLSDLLDDGWSGAMGVDSNHYNLGGENRTAPFPDSTKLKRLGVNTDGFVAT
uniref:Uncharacterized protein n=1 Tax=Hemiselmis andersenii TaxID=464988 RepID=A0A7S1HFM0_HEMAN